MQQRIARIAVTAVIAGVFGLLLATPRLHADDDRSKCQHAIEKAEVRLDHAIQRNGEHSPQAEARRHDLNEERERCWDRYHQWWNAREHRWETERNWDRDDHDDHDRH